MEDENIEFDIGDHENIEFDIGDHESVMQLPGGSDDAEWDKVISSVAPSVPSTKTKRNDSDRFAGRMRLHCNRYGRWL